MKLKEILTRAHRAMAVIESKGQVPKQGTTSLCMISLSDLRTLTELAEAIQTMHNVLPLGDLVYQVREHEAQGWEGPKVTLFGNAVQIVMNTVDKPEVANGDATNPS